MITSRPTQIYSCGQLLDGTSGRIGLLRRSDDATEDDHELRQRFADDGYLFIPGFLDKAHVRQARMSVIEALARDGTFDPAYPIEDAIAKPDLKLAFRPDLANGNPAVHSLLYSDWVMDFYKRLLGGRSMHYDYTWLRAVAPGLSTPPHYDIIYMGRGTNRICTAWIPLGDIPIDVGGLMILENSHRIEELRSGYGTMDVDVVCENKPGTLAVNDRGYPSFGAYSMDPVEVAERFDRRWLTSDFEMGDLLTFSMFTLHASTDNRSQEVRLSTDSRYQLASEAADPRWIGEKPIAHGPEAKIGMIC